MRVLHLNTHSSGGSYEYALLLSSALAEQGIDSHVLSRGSQLQPGKPFLDHVIRKAYVSLSTEPWHGTRRLLSPPHAEELQGFDVIHLHTVADWFNIPSWVETLPNGIGVVVSLHDMWHFAGGCFIYRGCHRFTETCTPCPILKAPFNHILAKREQRRKLQAYRSRRAQFVANSEWLADLAARSSIVRACGYARVIHPGVDTDFFRQQNKAQCRAELGIPMDAFVIAAAAASLTDANKNMPWLLEQLSGLPAREEVLVVVAGEGTLAIPCSLDVRLTGGIADRSKRAMLFSAADVFVSASLMETYGLTLIEAMGCGIPVVAFRTGGVPEAVPDEAGILCELLDADAFKIAIQKLRHSKELRNELGNAANRLVAARNAKSRFAAAFARLYEECCNDAKTPSTGQGSRSSPLHLRRENTMEGEALGRQRSALVP
jgi:glycosyltransferase involved in cell wall biosynthesis